MLPTKRKKTNIAAFSKPAFFSRHHLYIWAGWPPSNVSLKTHFFSKTHFKFLPQYKFRIWIYQDELWSKTVCRT